MPDNSDDADWTLGVGVGDPQFRTRPYSKVDSLESRIRRAIEILQPLADSEDLPVSDVGRAREAVSILSGGLA